MKAPATPGSTIHSTGAARRIRIRRRQTNTVAWRAEANQPCGRQSQQLQPRQRRRERSCGRKQRLQSCREWRWRQGRQPRHSEKLGSKQERLRKWFRRLQQQQCAVQQLARLKQHERLPGRERLSG